MRTTPARVDRTGWLTGQDVRLEDFVAVVAATTDLADYPHAEEVRSNVLVY